VTSDCKSSKISGLAFANIQGQQELISHHCDKNIMKKAVCAAVNSNNIIIK
jgi:hypothetical protein